MAPALPIPCGLIGPSLKGSIMKAEPPVQPTHHPGCGAKQRRYTGGTPDTGRVNTGPSPEYRAMFPPCTRLCLPPFAPFNGPIRPIRPIRPTSPPPTSPIPSRSHPALFTLSSRRLQAPPALPRSVLDSRFKVQGSRFKVPRPIPAILRPRSSTSQSLSFLPQRPVGSLPHPSTNPLIHQSAACLHPLHKKSEAPPVEGAS